MTGLRATPWRLLWLGLPAGCYDHAVVGEPDTGAAEADAGADAETECTRGARGEPLGCDFQCNDPEAPDFRIAHLAWRAPAMLTNPIIESIVNTKLDERVFVTLLDATSDRGFTLGAGRCDDPQSPAACGFDPAGPAPATGTWRYEGGVFRLPGTAESALDLRVPINSCDFGEHGRGCSPDWVWVLPLRALTLTGTVSHAANCVGTRTSDSLPSEWDTGGVLSGKITVPDARSVELGAPFHMTLCDLLSGDPDLEDGSCRRNLDPASWPHPPDTEVDGEPAWVVTADFAAIGVVIEEP